LQYFLTMSASNMLPSLFLLFQRPKIESGMPKGSQLVCVTIYSNLTRLLEAK